MTLAPTESSSRLFCPSSDREMHSWLGRSCKAGQVASFLISPISMIVYCGQGLKKRNQVKQRKDRFRLNVKEKKTFWGLTDLVYGDGFLSSTVECNALIFKPRENAQQGPIWPVWAVRLANLRLRHQASLFLSVGYYLAIHARQWKHRL